MQQRLTKISALAAVGCICLLGYVKWQWPAEAKELDIPTGRVMRMPGTNLKGICTQGDPNGLSLWYRVTPLTSNEVAQQQAMFEAMKNFKWTETK